MAISGQENDELGIISTNSVSSAVESVVSFDNTTGLQKNSVIQSVLDVNSLSGFQYRLLSVSCPDQDR
jgi:hypothetical protein